jgi:hydroxypyruvate isomerase
MNTKQAKELETITARQLRSILFNVENQDMTVSELRAMLYNVTEQDKEYNIDMAMFHRMALESDK